MKKCSGKAFSEVWTMFSSAQKAKGVSDITLRNYRQHLHNISKHFDIEMPFAIWLEGSRSVTERSGDQIRN